MNNDEIKEALRLHKMWIEDHKDGKSVDVNKLKLSEVDLSGMDLSGIDFSGCDLSGSDLRSCNFRHCNLSDTIFHAAHMDHADMGDMVVSGCNFNESSLIFSEMSESIFYDCNFEKANLKFANCAATRFIGCNMRSINLTYTLLGGYRTKHKFNYLRCKHMAPWAFVAAVFAMSFLILAQIGVYN